MCKISSLSIVSGAIQIIRDSPKKCHFLKSDFVFFKKSLLRARLAFEKTCTMGRGREVFNPLSQGSHARCPPDAFLLATHISKIYNIINFEEIELNFRAFPVVCGPYELFCPINCGLQSFFSLECGPPINSSLRPLKEIL
jgi:hypothetical protein